MQLNTIRETWGAENQKWLGSAHTTTNAQTVKAYPDNNGNVVIEYLADNVGETSLGNAADVLKKAVQNQAYDVTILATGDVEPYTFAAVGDLPGGLELEAPTGRLHGTTAETGSKKITIKVADSKKRSAQKELTLQIAPAED